MDKETIQKQALQAILPHKNAGISMSMGTGKTKLGLEYIAAHYTDYMKVLVVAPNRSIFKAWRDDAEKFGLSYLLPHIRFSTYLSLNKQDLDYDLVIYDEAHSLKNSHLPYLGNHKGKTLGMSGTIPKLDHTERGILMNLYWPIKYEYATDEAVEDGILNDYRIIVHSLELDTERTIQKVTKQGKVWYTSELNEYEYWCKKLNESTSMKTTQIMRIMRMKALMGFPSKEVLARKLMGEINGKTIIFCNTIEQCRRMCTYTYDSKNPNSEQNLEDFNSGKLQRLGCVLMLSQGVNIRGLKNSIIFHSYSNNKKLAQRLGRNLRLAVDDVAYIHVLMFKNTIDQNWVKESTSEFDPTKITWL
jgi:superfamily II DNA or RNA helicase